VDKIETRNGQMKPKLKYVELANSYKDRLIKLIGDSMKHMICDTYNTK